MAHHPTFVENIYDLAKAYIKYLWIQRKSQMIHCCFVWFSVTQHTYYNHDLKRGHQDAKIAFFNVLCHCHLMYGVTVYIECGRKIITLIVQVWYLFHQVVNCHIFCSKILHRSDCCTAPNANISFSIKPQFFPLSHHFLGLCVVHRLSFVCSKIQCPEVAHR